MQCQKCRQPVHIDGSLDNLNAAAFKLLIDSSAVLTENGSLRSRQARPTYSQDRRSEYEKASQPSRSPIFKRSLPHRSNHGSEKYTLTADGPGMSFVMLSESQVETHTAEREGESTIKTSDAIQDATNLKHRGNEVEMSSQRMDKTSRLFEILSARSDIDHPICTECTELLVAGLQKRLGHTTRERDAYVEFLRNANVDIPSEEEIKQAQEALGAMSVRETTAIAELEKLESEKAALDLELQVLDDESEKLNIAEEEFWRERNAFAAAFSEFKSQRDAINTKYNHDSKQLERLQRTNVFNDTFNIGHDNYFGTINGLRLGRLSNHPVEWPEINAAWGQTCLLLATVADRLSFKFQNYRLVPMGSTSIIVKVEYLQSKSTNDPSHPAKPKETSLELFSHGDMPLGLGGLWHKKFDNAMIAFLECLRQIGDSVTASPVPDNRVSLKLPYEIKKDKIHDTSIKFSFSSEENWTKACKYVLTCCKYLLAHASNLHNPPQQQIS
ncbi:APG6-domain-containing protein [Pseudovirgaria hyperparasitica]|uniref:APG6-domain-containing protein n=1 Tax=Pseudovirgaria hyperparasitica TaxID=470096 RepID=A0A6A6VVH9_9PEZI|nr:APG6-domain-containing protein [Pseudovirgaria hyperparasitica]KAF2753251.1 APG6-domain-containing protein [Pseudovirgaria hyperparasitica]